MQFHLPPSDEILPYWLFLISALSVWNTLQTFLFLPRLTLTSRVYAGPNAPAQLTQLSARTFAAWTFLTAVVRFYAACRIHDRDWYAVALWTFLVAGVHFATELAVYSTVKLRSGAAPSLCIAAASIVWMMWQWGEYVS